MEEHNKDQDDNILNKIDDFFKSYTGTLDEVNDSHSPKGLSKFVLEDSPFYDNLVSDIKNHRISSIKSSNIMNVSRNGQFYSVIVQNEDNKGRNEQGHYLLKGNDDAEQLKIVNYERYQ
ncbi:TcaA NTF2-like domain-containing protein [Staphylococcus agnetis]|uniref:TcaA NTF2-like domain-containing protein n=1 Tax=Staphylococcus agnetis TaxID=985762 RepID=UPI003B97F074